MRDSEAKDIWGCVVLEPEFRRVCMRGATKWRARPANAQQRAEAASSASERARVQKTLAFNDDTGSWATPAAR
eukprot:6181642-Pleurochrysis_carterae.AAC.1